MVVFLAEQFFPGSVEAVWNGRLTVTLLPTKERLNQRAGPGNRDVSVTMDRNIAVLLLGITLTTLAFLAYGGRSDMTEVSRRATPIHIYHHDIEPRLN